MGWDMVKLKEMRVDGLVTLAETEREEDGGENVEWRRCCFFKASEMRRVGVVVVDGEREAKVRL